MRVDAKELKQGLSKIGYAISSVPDIEILSCVLFKVEPNRLTLTGFDLVIGITTTINAIVEESYTIGVPYKLIKDIVANLVGELKITYKNNQLNIIAGVGEFKLATMGAEEYPDLIATKFSDADYFALDWEDIAPNLKLTAEIASKDASKLILTGICFNGAIGQETDYNELAATDSQRLIVTRLASELPNKTFVVSYQLIEAALLAFSKEAEVAFAQQDTIVSFKTPTTNLVGFTITGNYPKYNQVLPTDFKYQLQIDKQALAAALVLVSPIQEDKFCKVTLTHQQDLLKLTSFAKEKGEATTTVACPGESPDLKITLNLNQLQTAIKPIKSEITIRVKSNTTPVILSNDWINHLLMPLHQS